jgi:hypothetical protein
MRPSDNPRGMALIVMLLTMGLLSALGVALVLVTTAETRIAANFRMAQQTLYATEAAVARAADELMSIPDWNALVAGGVLSSFSDGPPSGVRQLADRSSIDLTEVVNVANCQTPASCSDADMDAVTDDRPWGPNNPRWKLFAYGWLRDLVPAHGVDPPHYLVVMVGDDPGETDNDPVRDAAAGGPGAGIVALRAEAFGPGGAHKVVELTAMRGESAIRVLSWREVR